MANRAEQQRRRREERLDAERRASDRRRLRIRLIAVAVAVVVVIGAVVGFLVGRGSSGAGKGGGQVATSPSTRAAGAPLPGAQNGAPPWPANNGDQLADRLRAIGLPALSAEGTVLHTHQHLDILFEGHRVAVPADVGIDANQQFISPLHTHDQTGIVHVESPTVRTFTLGQFFDVWGVPLSASELGGQPTGNGYVLRAWVNGLRVHGNPADIRLTAHEEIVIAYGTAKQMPKRVPSSFAFPPGD